VAQDTLTHRGTMTGYVGHGPEVRADAGSPKPASATSGPQFRQPFTDPGGPLGEPAQHGPEKRLERPEQLEGEPARR
jgi:hypothetical protein